MARDTLLPIEPAVVGRASDKMDQLRLRPSFTTSHGSHRSEVYSSYRQNAASRHADYSRRPSGVDGLQSFLYKLPPSHSHWSPDTRPPQASNNHLSISSLLSPSEDDTSEHLKHPRLVLPTARSKYDSRGTPPLDRRPYIEDTFAGRPREQFYPLTGPDHTAYRSTEHYLPANTREPPSLPPYRQYNSSSDAGKAQHSPASTAHTGTRSIYTGSSVTPSRTPVVPDVHNAPSVVVAHSPELNYGLIIRQQPVAARACGFGERDRRVIDPPPIVELRITDKGTGVPKQDLRGQFALHCTLFSPDGDKDETVEKAYRYDLPSSRRLMGTLVASPYQAKDEHGEPGAFFVFADLSCRCPGKYKLHFKLLRIDPTTAIAGSRHGTVTTAETEPFSVYAAKDFPGMRASTPLLRALRDQGLNVGLKKGTESRTVNARKRGDESSDGADSSASENDAKSVRDDSREPAPSVIANSKPKRKKKPKKRRRAI